MGELGITQVVQDEVYNVIADVPATQGCEDLALTIVQGHMDMVCVAKPGVDYDPLTSEIKLVREGNILRADGTSLGADDGIAVAVALYLIQQPDVQHGPLRLIFTVDEETGMTGATHLDPKYVQDAKYVLNCDSEYIDVLCVGSAGSVHTHFYRTLTRRQPQGAKAVAVMTNPLYMESELTHQIKDSGAKHLITLDIFSAQDRGTAGTARIGRLLCDACP